MEVTTRLDLGSGDAEIVLDLGDQVLEMRLNLNELREVLSRPVVKMLLNMSRIPGIEVRIRRKGAREGP